MSSGLPGSRPSPTNTPSSSSFDNAPAGPSSATDRMRTGGRRQLAGINNTLQQATLQDSGRSGSLRRGSSRLSIPGSDAQLLAGHSRPATPSTERHEPLRRDQMPNDRPGGDGPSRPPPVDGGDHQRGDGDRSRRDRERSDRTDRSGRPSRRSSRERSPDREREPKEHREHRERRSGPSGLSASSTRDGERDSGSRRSGRDLPSGHWESQSGHRDANGATSSGNTGGRDSMGGSSSRESRHRGDRSSEQGTLRNEDWNRKRRTEEGVGGSSDRDKRQRR